MDKEILPLISDEYRNLNSELHQSNKYGKWGYRNKQSAEYMYKKFNCKSALDYGCGQATLSKHVSFKVNNYDPCIEKYSKEPSPADLVLCTDVLEHIEPDLLENVLEHIENLTKKAVLFLIDTEEDSTKLLPDGRNPHLIVEPIEWWKNVISRHFDVFLMKQIDDGSRWKLYCEVKKDVQRTVSCHEQSSDPLIGDGEVSG